MLKPYSYSIFFDFIESYLPSGFLKINADDPIMQRLEQVMEENDQFITACQSGGRCKFVFTSKRNLRDDRVDRRKSLIPAILQDAMHPDDFERLGLAESTGITGLRRRYFKHKKGSAVLSY
ncbi:MAG: hypothetical protein MZV63_49730 [Marinilabiliales bacterium]|nr:hypothetical protein [Marinilabiliales bacterium]